MKYLITESQLEAFLLRRFTMDELEALRDDYNYIMDEEDFEDFVDRHRGEEFFQYDDDTEFYNKRSEYIRALLKFLNTN
jgi:hypothetical protein